MAIKLCPELLSTHLANEADAALPKEQPRTAANPKPASKLRTTIECRPQSICRMVPKLAAHVPPSISSVAAPGRHPKMTSKGPVAAVDRLGAKTPERAALPPPPLMPLEEGHRAPTKKSTVRNRKLLRLTDPQSKLRFLKEHPYFHDASPALRERLAPQMVRRSHDGGASEVSAARVVEQGREPHGDTEYLFLTGPESHMRLEVLYDGRPIASLGDSCVFGQEVIFGVTKSFLFSIRVAVGSVNSLWVIPRPILQSLLHMEAYKSDAELLRARAERQIIALLHGWYTNPASHSQLRLFQNADHAFQQSVINSMSMKIVRAGSTIRAALEPDSRCFCVFRGEAQVLHRQEFLAKLSHEDGSSGWGAWFGLLECLGVCKVSPVQIDAVTDSIVWTLNAEDLASLRSTYTTECRLFDKVALEHLKMLSPFATSISQIPLFSKSKSSFLTALTGLLTQRVCGAGVVVVEEDSDCRQLFFLARGNVEVRKTDADVRKSGQARLLRGLSGSNKESMMSESVKFLTYGPLIANLAEGAIFGELRALGCTSQRTATVVTTSPCDLRVCMGGDVLDLLGRWPAESIAFAELFSQHGFPEVKKAIQSPMQDFPLFEATSRAFLDELGRESQSRVFFDGQLLFDQNVRILNLYVLVYGCLSVAVDRDPIAKLRAPTVLGEPVSIYSRRPSASTAIPASRTGGRYGSDVDEITCFSWFEARSSGWTVFHMIQASRLEAILKDAFPHERTLLQKLGQDRDDQIKETLFGTNVAKQSLRSQSEYAEDEELSEEDDMSKQIVELMQNSESFKESDLEFCNFLAQHVKKEIYLSGQVIIRQGDEGDWAIIIKSGKCAAEVDGTRVGEIKAGGIIGEAAALGTASSRTATVIATTLVTGYVLSRLVVTAAFELFPVEHERIMRLVESRRDARQVLAGEKELQVSRQPPSPLSSVTDARRLLRIGTSPPASPKKLGSRNFGFDGVAEPSRSERRFGMGEIFAAQSRGTLVLSSGDTQVARKSVHGKTLSAGLPTQDSRTATSPSNESKDSPLAQQKRRSRPTAKSASPDLSSEGIDAKSDGFGRKYKESRRGDARSSEPLQADADRDLLEVDTEPAHTPRRIGTSGDAADPRGRGEEASPSLTPDQQPQPAPRLHRSKKSLRLQLVPDVRLVESPMPEGPWSLQTGFADDEDFDEGIFGSGARDLDDIIEGHDLVSDRPLTAPEQWAQKRREAMGLAPTKQMGRMAKADQMMPLIPQRQGYMVPQAGGRTKLEPYTSERKVRSGSQGSGSSIAPWQRRLQRVGGLYGLPVWHEFFGG